MILTKEEIDFIQSLLPRRVGYFYRPEGYDRIPVDITKYRCKCGCYQEYVFYNECPKCHAEIDTPEGIKWKAGTYSDLAYECGAKINPRKGLASASTISYALKSERDASPKIIMGICHALDITKEELYECKLK